MRQTWSISATVEHIEPCVPGSSWVWWTNTQGLHSSGWKTPAATWHPTGAVELRCSSILFCKMKGTFKGSITEGRGTEDFWGVWHGCQRERKDAQLSPTECKGGDIDCQTFKEPRNHHWSLSQFLWRQNVEEHSSISNTSKQHFLFCAHVGKNIFATFY